MTSIVAVISPVLAVTLVIVSADKLPSTVRSPREIETPVNVQHLIYNNPESQRESDDKHVKNI